MITAILLGFLGLFLGMVGLRCTNIGGLERYRKTKLAATAGALHILAGNWGKVTGGGCAAVGVGWPLAQTARLPHLPLCIDTCPLSLLTPLSPILTKSLGESIKSVHQQCFLSPH